MRIYKFFADLRNVPRIVAIQIVIYYYMAPAVGRCAITWLLPTVGARSLRCFAIRSLGTAAGQLASRGLYPISVPRAASRQIRDL